MVSRLRNLVITSTMVGEIAKSVLTKVVVVGLTPFGFIIF